MFNLSITHTKPQNLKCQKQQPSLETHFFLNLCENVYYKSIKINSMNINAKTIKLVDVFPISGNFSKEIKTFSLGKASEFPKKNDFSKINREVFKSHSSVFDCLKNKKFTDFFKYLESNKTPSVYIFWVNSNDQKTLKLIHDSYKKISKQSRKSITSVNDFNAELLTLYVGKSENGADSRAICHLDYTSEKYKSLKITNCCADSEIMATIINFQIENKADQFNFWKKILPFSLEYYIAENLKPILGRHQ